MWMDYEDYGMGWGWLGWLGMAFFWVILILLVLAAVKYLTGGRRLNAPGGEERPMRWLCWRNDMPGAKSVARSTCRNATI